VGATLGRRRLIAAINGTQISERTAVFTVTSGSGRHTPASALILAISGTQIRGQLLGLN